MNIADDNQNPRPGKKLSKSLDAIAALRLAMEQRLAEAQGHESEAPESSPIPESMPQTASEPALQPVAKETPPIQEPKSGSASVETSEKEAPRKSAPSPKTQKPEAQIPSYAPTEWSRIMFRIADRSQRLIQNYVRQQKSNAPSMPAFDPAHILEALMELSNRILNDPERFTAAQLALWQGYIRIWQQTFARMQGQDTEPVVTPAPTDKRFKDKDWQNVWVFDFIKQSYLLTAQWVHGLVKQEAEKLDPKLAHKLDFYIDQFIDALSPSNFWLTNPEVLRTTFESGGENLVKGLENLLEDLERGHGQLRISMTDAQAFKVGKNLAITPGEVVYRNELIELIQYAPSTPQVNRTPLLIIPPWINKYYILDLRETNSMIRWLVAQGYTVFCISWVNPDGSYAETDFGDYMTEGAFAAMREVKKAASAEDINVVGYCIGGTLLASALAWLKAAPEPPRDLPNVASATYFVTMVDFAEPGDLGVFIDEDQVKAIEERMQQQGYLDAASMALTFNLLRSNDLIWSFVVNNYLLGKEPFPFDILYWNGDSTNLPAAMHRFYLREMYMKNLLAQPDGLAMKGVPINLRKIMTPSFLLATREDHIAPWRSTYGATQLYQGPVKFVLAGSGHIAGVVNPPDARKYGYWTNDEYTPDAEAWFQAAAPHNGSWWPEWMKWLEPFAGGKIPPRAIGKSLDPAPGTYVLAKTV